MQSAEQCDWQLARQAVPRSPPLRERLAQPVELRDHLAHISVAR